MRAIYEANKGVNGAPRIHDALADEVVRCGHKRVARLMQEHHLQAKTVRRFKVDRPNLVCASDITHIRMREGWVYLMVILDLRSRRVVGWELGTRLTSALITSAMHRALETRSIVVSNVRIPRGC